MIPTSKVTFCIPTYNQPQKLLRCLETLHRHTPEGFRVIVLEQGETDVYDVIKPYVHLFIRSYRNLGFAKACNYMARLTDTEYVCFLNDDVEFINKKWWDGTMSTFERYDATEPQTLCVNPGSMRKLDAVGEPVDEKGFEYKEDYTEEEYDAMVLKESEGREQGIIVDGITPWCAIFHLQGFKDVGMFDEAYYPGGGEDYDLQNRAYLRGKTAQEEGKVVRHRCLGTSFGVVWHWWCSTKSTMGETDSAFKIFSEAQQLYTKKWGTKEFPNPYPNGSQSKKLDELEYPEALVQPL
jgi:GT2 family glycosyltransferase